jgi:hypothetical protein
MKRLNDMNSKVCYISYGKKNFLNAQHAHTFSNYSTKTWVVCDTQTCLRIRGKNLCVHGEDARDTKLCIHQLIIIRFSIFSRFFLHYMGWIRPLVNIHDMRSYKPNSDNALFVFKLRRPRKFSIVLRAV